MLRVHRELPGVREERVEQEVRNKEEAKPQGEIPGALCIVLYYR